ncbi:MAG: hypothetical protein DMF78_10290 [Acidobacteria bacterium]|nr:MAG: hypothetical protein DMF78_10290 [Acidobacteriota bacterium]
MKLARALAAAAVLLPLPLWAEPPSLDHQPSPCTVPDKPASLCATITADGQVGAARIYFRPAGEKFYSFVDMAFGGLNFCGTLPAPRGGKVQALEYYVQAVDDRYESQRTSTFNLEVKPDCEFPPLEKDSVKASSIVVHATNQKQGKKLPDEFVSTGVSFLPVATK